MNAPYGSQSDGITWSVPLADGARFPLVFPLSLSQSHASIALVVASCISLVAAVGLLSGIVMSAFNTRMDKDPNMFVRTHFVYYFASLLLADILQAISGIVNSTWIREHAVIYGSLCTAQGVIKHLADVGVAIWSLVIATHTFSVLFLRLPVKRNIAWIVILGNWSLLFTIVIAGPATASVQKDGPYYGIVGYWCWISASYTVQRVALDYMIMFLSAVLTFILYTLVFLKLRGIVRARARSTSVVSAEQESREKYEHRLARQMLLFPIAYTVMIIPITCCRFSAWAGHNVPFALTTLSDFIYLLSGLVHAILFACTRSIIRPQSMLPKFKFFISRPQILSSTAVPDNNFDSYFRYLPTRSSSAVTEKSGVPSTIIEALDPKNPFADPVLPPIDETRRQRDRDRFDRADSVREVSPFPSPSMLSPGFTDYIDRSFAPKRPNPLKDELKIDTSTSQERQVEVPVIRTPPTHREGEKIEVPMSPDLSPDSVLHFYDDA